MFLTAKNMCSSRQYYTSKGDFNIFYFHRKMYDLQYFIVYFI